MIKLKESSAVFVGATLGGLARYLLGLDLPTLAGLSLGTLLVNYLGTFLLVFFVKGYLSQKGLSSSLQLALGTGFCGSFTTFSSAMLDLFKLLRAGNYLAFGFYSFLIIVGGLVVAYLSYCLLTSVEGRQ